MPEDFVLRLRRLAPFFIGGFGVALMATGIGINYIQKHQEPVLGEKKEVVASPPLRELSPRKIKVDVSGAVEKSGVYEIPDDYRVKDVLITAGGLAAKADRNYISKNINMAQKLFDGQKVYFPFQNDTSNSTDLLRIPTNSTIASQVNINTASADQLDGLPGIGPVTANKIIAGRPYQNVSELLSRKVVSNSVYQKIKDKIAIN